MSSREGFAGIRALRSRFLGAVAVGAMIVLAPGCTDSPDPTIESLGLSVRTEIQAGATFEMAVPAQDDTRIAVLSNPDGISTATFVADGMNNVAIEVDADMPRGDYNLVFRVLHDGREYDLPWPFTVTDPGGSAS